MTIRSKKNFPPLLVILGQTGAGKSALAVRLARRFSGELISADSRQVYRGMDIATNKLKPPRDIRQWLVDVVEPDRPFTLRHYQRAAFAAIRDIHRRGKLPIVVGGTMQYIDAVVQNWSIPKARPERRLRKILERDLQDDGLAALVRRLKRLDPESARRIDIRNPRRVVRALEVALATGSSFVGQRRKDRSRFNVLEIGLVMPRDELQQRLYARAERMFRQGFLRETKRLLEKYSFDLPSMSGIGYAEAAVFIKGDISRTEMINRIVTHSMQYARRQMTWWKRDAAIHWTRDPFAAVAATERWLKEQGSSAK